MTDYPGVNNVLGAEGTGARSRIDLEIRNLIDWEIPKLIDREFPRSDLLEFHIRVLGNQKMVMNSAS